MERNYVGYNELCSNISLISCFVRVNEMEKFRLLFIEMMKTLTEMSKQNANINEP